MTDVHKALSSIDDITPAPSDLQSIADWLDAPMPLNAADDIPPIQKHLATLRANCTDRQRHFATLDRLYTRCISVVSNLRPSLVGTSLPISRRTRQLIRNLQDMLRSLADEYESTLARFVASPSPEQEMVQERILGRILFALAQHLFTSNLVAAQAGNGIWQQLHKTYETARRLNIVRDTKDDTPPHLQKTYYAAVLLGCAQPASFTADEVNFVAAYLELFADQVDFALSAPEDSPARFWIDPERDAPAVACSRKAAPPETKVRYFACDRLAALLNTQLADLESGHPAEQIGLPDFANSPAGRGVLRRLVVNWGYPGTRRFPRRRQSYRAVLCAGLDSLWQLFQNEEVATVDTSTWMITNESPDGYSVMHVAGKTGRVSVGDVIALRSESGENWQICIVRWAFSENPEHLELGLQILATRATPAILARPGAPADIAERLSVLLLPQIQALRATEMIVAPSGALEEHPDRLVLVVERENIEVREVKGTRLDEQNSYIEVFSIEPDERP
jgi:hypothetical protein